MAILQKMLRATFMPFKIFRLIYNHFRYGQFGRYSCVKSPLRIDCPQNIYIGNSVIVGYKAWLAAVPLTNTESKLIIDDGCTLGNYNHIYATCRIMLHKNVLTADKVYISDNSHCYEDVNVPIMHQPIIQRSTVEIGEGSWLGENVCVLGANIGKHCVIGSNSVVTSNIPDYSVAVGAPAKVIKKYDFDRNQWVKV